MRDCRRAKLGRGESKRGHKVVMGRQDWGRMWCSLAWGSLSLSILDQDTDGDKKLRDKLPVNRADD